MPNHVNSEMNRLFRMGTVGALTDLELLDRFVNGDVEGSERAFEVLVERHGAMVMNVCLGVLRDRHAAEDAFQATFVVLVRKRDGCAEKGRSGAGCMASHFGRPGRRGCRRHEGAPESSSWRTGPRSFSTARLRARISMNCCTKKSNACRRHTGWPSCFVTSKG